MTQREPAPLFGSWAKAYGFALGIFSVELLLLYVFTIIFS